MRNGGGHCLGWVPGLGNDWCEPRDGFGQHIWPQTIFLIELHGVKVQFLLLMATSDRVEKWNNGQCTKVEVTFGEMLTECSATARNLFRLRVKLFLGR